MPTGSTPRPFRSCMSLDVDAHAGAAHHPTHGPTHPRRSSTPARRGCRPQRRWLRARGHQGPWRTAGAAPGHLPRAGPRRGAHSAPPRDLGLPAGPARTNRPIPPSRERRRLRGELNREAYANSCCAESTSSWPAWHPARRDPGGDRAARAGACPVVPQCDHDGVGDGRRDPPAGPRPAARRRRPVGVWTSSVWVAIVSGRSPWLPAQPGDRCA
jgi:hypothetical protein